MFKEIFLLCSKNFSQFTKGKCYQGTRGKDDPYYWVVKNDGGKQVLVHENETCEYFHRAFFPSDFKNVCNSHPELIAPIPFEWDTKFKYFYDNSPTEIKTGKKTIDALSETEAKAKITNLWPNVHNIQVCMRKEQYDL